MRQFCSWVLVLAFKAVVDTFSGAKAWALEVYAKLDPDDPSERGPRR